MFSYYTMRFFSWVLRGKSRSLSSPKVDGSSIEMLLVHTKRFRRVCLDGQPTRYSNGADENDAFYLWMKQSEWSNRFRVLSHRTTAAIVVFVTVVEISSGNSGGGGSVANKRRRTICLSARVDPFTPRWRRRCRRH